MDPSGGIASGISPEEIDEGRQIVVGDGFPLGHLFRRGSGGVSGRSGDAIGNLPQAVPGLQGEDLDILPDLELALLIPDVAHLGKGVTLNHRLG